MPYNALYLECVRYRLNWPGKGVKDGTIIFIFLCVQYSLSNIGNKKSRFICPALYFVSESESEPESESIKSLESEPVSELEQPHHDSASLDKSSAMDAL